MNFDIQSFNKKNNYLICIDSDGTVIDAMNAKHNHCHGPAFIEHWHLQEHSKTIQELWNDINLYRISRGVNRFIALVKILKIINGTFLEEDNINILEHWVNSTDDLSNNGLQKEIKSNPAPILMKAYEWSMDINRRISTLSLSDKPSYDGVKECLHKWKSKIDIAIVSSSNMSAIIEEWDNHDLLQFPDVIASQEVGTKEECIRHLISKGYSPTNVLMIGDAYPDLHAAESNNCYFYPILIKNESDSWQRLNNQYLEQFILGRFDTLQEQMLMTFKNNFAQEGE